MAIIKFATKTKTKNNSRSNQWSIIVFNVPGIALMIVCFKDKFTTVLERFIKRVIRVLLEVLYFWSLYHINFLVINLTSCERVCKPKRAFLCYRKHLTLLTLDHMIIYPVPKTQNTALGSSFWKCR